MGELVRLRSHDKKGEGSYQEAIKWCLSKGMWPKMAVYSSDEPGFEHDVDFEALLKLNSSKKHKLES